MFTLALIGRPNVGKSTLFNRLTGRKVAIVHDTPGLTRDTRTGLAELFDLKFNLIDTAGLEEAKEGIKKAAFEKSLQAISDADALLFMVDVRAGLLPDDEYFARLARSSGKKVVLLANKCEASSPDLNSLLALGFGEPIAFSAEHGLGISELYEALSTFIEPAGDEEEGSRPLSLSIVGRPNAGKSTLVNAILGYERMITSDVAGTTLDAIDTLFEYEGRPIKLIDTAGLRRKSNVTSIIEGMAVSSALESVKKSEVVVLLIDATVGVQKQDLEIADFAVREGKALVMAVNKWDLVKEKANILSSIEERFEKSFSQVKGFDVLTISAIQKKGVPAVMKAASAIYEKWNKRVTTGKLNTWLSEIVKKKHPPLSKFKRPINLKYLTQKSTRPPSFVLFSSVGSEMPANYLRFLTNQLKKDFGFEGVVIRFISKKSNNPFAKGSQSAGKTAKKRS